jgi:bifunctional non-homologous end joining protein LigD
VAPFSPRSRPGAAVSLPLSWSELKLPERPVVHVADFDDWKNRLRRDPWKQFLKSRQRITSKMLAVFKISSAK